MTFRGCDHLNNIGEVMQAGCAKVLDNIQDVHRCTVSIPDEAVE